MLNHLKHVHSMVNLGEISNVNFSFTLHVGATANKYDY